ncbi:uncharacterized protein LOC131284676 [Anopheles ziemanni]|uniref:uncharacterized protein LOC131260314 n=1 Tax=Anopheles coustani TaxID=139045 RepID=UPI002659C665|nr:uncharacterized protein LOC131260314 [Anopheles coustani]XP_058169523.1 uncharacterized protein LOC131284676 [Anopheles ziemanni]
MEVQWKFILLMIVGQVVCQTYNESDPGDSKVLTRKKRFLLFTPGSHILLTAAFGKNLMFRGPAGYVCIGELDMYYPLPDYKYHASSLKLGGVATYPPEPMKSPPPTPPPPPPPPPKEEHHDHHNGGELSPAEVDQYLKDHPGTWVPPGWGKERADWNRNTLQYSSPQWAAAERMDENQYQNPPSSNLNRYLGGIGYGGGNNISPYQYSGWNPTSYDRYRRSAALEQKFADDAEEEHERDKWLSGEAFNISQHSDWEHFHHYRDRRALFNHLEETIGSVTGFHMKECILRSICEAKNMLPPPGRSMAMDIFRVLFSFPINEALNDDYSNAMRQEPMDCRAQYSDGCPMSLLDLVLFGKFEP